MGGLDTYSNNIAARVQMHTHTNTCTEYQKKRMRSRSNIVPIMQSKRIAIDIEDPQNRHTQHPRLLQLCRFLSQDDLCRSLLLVRRNTYGWEEIINPEMRQRLNRIRALTCQSKIMR